MEFFSKVFIFWTGEGIYRRFHLFSFVLMWAWIVHSTCVSADDSPIETRIEIGGGISAYRMQSRPDWSSKYYTNGLGTCAFRLYRGLYIESGAEFGLGGVLRSEWFGYSENVRLNTSNGTFTEEKWLGVRYMVPARTLNTDILGVQFVYTSLGMMFSSFGIRTTSWEEGETVKGDDRVRRFDVARVSGPYITVAGRWLFHFENTEEQEADSWRGSYGFDIGVRYVRYTSSRTRYETIMAPKSNFNCFQVYIVGFMGIRFLY